MKKMIALLCLTVLIGLFVFKEVIPFYEFQNARQELHEAAYASFENNGAKAYEIIFDIREKYTKTVGTMAIINVTNNYVSRVINADTEYISVLMQIIANNEASRFYLKHQRIPSRLELDDMIETEVPDYAYLASLQCELRFINTLTYGTATSSYGSGYRRKGATEHIKNLKRLFKLADAKLTALIAERAVN